MESEAQRGNRSNQNDFRGAQGVVFISGSWLSVFALVIAACALGVAINASANQNARTNEAITEAGHVKAAAARELAVEQRLWTEEVKDLRLEFKNTMRRAGVDPADTEAHGK